MKKIGVILSGCGYLDGSEIQETIMTLYFLSKKEDVEIYCMAPNINQVTVIDHLNETQMDGHRNVLSESARMTIHGIIEDIKNINHDDLDALIIPGGAGVVLNLCSFRTDGIGCEVNKDVSDLIINMIRKKKIIGAICVAPVLVAKVCSLMGLNNEVFCTGGDQTATQALHDMGALTKQCAADDIVIDSVNHIISTPAYSLGTNIIEVSEGIEKLVNKVMEMLRQP